MSNSVWPKTLRIRDTGLHDEGGGQRIYTTAGRGYEKREYVRADELERLTALLKDREARIDWLGNALSEAEAENERLDKDLTQTIGERDRAEDQATNLANMVGKFFQFDPGEHSNANCPIENSCEFLNEQLANRTAFSESDLADTAQESDDE